jgi:hypothetical protein
MPGKTGGLVVYLAACSKETEAIACSVWVLFAGHDDVATESVGPYG